MFLLCACDTSTTLYVAAVVLEIQVYYLATSVAGDGKELYIHLPLIW